MEAHANPPALAEHTVQREWDNTLQRLRACCELVQASELVDRSHVAHLTLRKTDDTTLHDVERILMDNLLFALWTKTEREHEVSFAGEWLYRWRRAVPWRCEAIGHMSRLVPGTPQRQFTYRFNIIEVE